MCSRLIERPSREGGIMKAITLMTLLMVFPIFRPQPARAQSSSQTSCHEITVFGAVNMPGHFEMKRRMRLLEALAIAGGPNKRAGKTVRVIHSCKCSPCSEAETRTSDIEYDLATALRGRDSANPNLAAGDLVIVPETEVVFTRGNVLSEKSLIFREGVTLTQAIATVGIARNSDLVRVKIHHPTTTSQRYSFEVVNLKAIKEGHVADPLLRP